MIQRNAYNGVYQNFVSYRELDGTEVTDAKKNMIDKRGSLTGQFSQCRERAFLFHFRALPASGRYSDDTLTFWYFIHDGARDGRGYFVGYDIQSKLCVGFIGRDGFRPDLPPVEQWFPVDGVRMAYNTAFLQPFANSGEFDGKGSEPWKLFMISGTELLEIDLRTRSVTRLMESADLITVRAVDRGRGFEGRRRG